MPLEVITAPPGGGKTLYGVTVIVDEYLRTDRLIITNVAIHRDAFFAYCAAKGKPADHSRLILFTEGDDIKLREYWVYAIRPALIVIDEGAVVLPSRSTGDDWDTKSFVQHVTQHRKLGHDIVVIVTHLELLHSVVLKNCQFVTTVRNLGYGVMLGAGWQGRFTAKKTLGGSGKGVVVHPWSFTLDKQGIASLYQTNAGVGFVGAGESSAKKKLKDIRAVVLVYMVGAMGLMLLLNQGGEWVVRWMSKDRGAVVGGKLSQFGTNAVPSGEVRQTPSNYVSALTNEVAPAEVKYVAPVLLPRITGYLREGETSTFYLDDGREVSCSLGEVGNLGGGDWSLSGLHARWSLTDSDPIWKVVQQTGKGFFAKVAK